MQFFSHHIFSVILFTPLVGAILVLLFSRERADLHRSVGNLFACSASSSPFRWSAHFPVGLSAIPVSPTADWIPSIGARYSLGIDGISLLLIMLTTCSA